MRLRILDHGHGFRTKALFALIRMVSRHRCSISSSWSSTELILWRTDGGSYAGSDARTLHLVGR